jgi:hypothetical protein
MNTDMASNLLVRFDSRSRYRRGSGGFERTTQVDPRDTQQNHLQETTIRRLLSEPQGVDELE